LLALLTLVNVDVGAMLLYGKYPSLFEKNPEQIVEIQQETEALAKTEQPVQLVDNVINVDIIVEEPVPAELTDDELVVLDELRGEIEEPTPEARFAPANYMLADKSNFRQDERGWAYDPLGHTNQTMREFGCTVTSVANAITNYDKDFVTPRILNNNLIKASGYTDRGWLKWSAISAATEGKYSARIFTSPSNANIDFCLLNNEYPVVKIFLRGTVQHWVLIVGKSNGEYLIRDPLEGDRAEKPILLSERADKVHSLRCIRRN
jgi:hypothetical protein